MSCGWPVRAVFCAKIRCRSSTSPRNIGNIKQPMSNCAKQRRRWNFWDKRTFVICKVCENTKRFKFILRDKESERWRKRPVLLDSNCHMIPNKCILLYFTDVLFFLRFFKRTNRNSLTVQMICLNVGRNFRFPFVTVVQQLLLVVQQLFVRFGGEFKVRSLDDGVDRASFLLFFGKVNFKSIRKNVKHNKPDRIHSKYTWSCQCRTEWYVDCRRHVLLPQW